MFLRTLISKLIFVEQYYYVNDVSLRDLVQCRIEHVNDYNL